MTRVLSFILMMAAAIMPLMAILAPLGLAPLSTLVLVAGLVCLRPRLGMDRPLLIVVLVLFAWAGIGIIWAQEPWQTAKTVARLLAVVLAGLAVVHTLRRFPEPPSLLLPLSTGIVLCLPLLLWEYSTDRGFSEFVLAARGIDSQLIGNKSPLSRGATVISVLIWPAFYMLQQRKGIKWGVFFVVSASLILFLGDSGSSKQALIAGLSIFALCWIFPVGRVYKLVRYGLVLLVASAPLIIASLPDPHTIFQSWLWLPNSSHHRLTIWGFTTRHVFQHPIRGWAIDASRAIPGADEEIEFVRYDEQGRIVLKLTEAQLPLHPHNTILQWWLELGLIGVVFITAMIWFVLRRMESCTTDRAAGAAMLGMFCTISSISLTSYGAWQSWWHGAIWLVAMFWAVALPRLDKDRL